MEGYKSDFIEYALSQDALRLRKKDNSDFILKSGRKSPWFFNAGSFSSGEASGKIGDAYAQLLIASDIDFDILYGIPEKGSGLIVATAMKLYDDQNGGNYPWFFTRKIGKSHGESTGADNLRKMVVGTAPEDGMRIATIDDVMTSGTTKYEALGLLQSLGNFEYPLLAIAIDRQEAGDDGTSAIETYEQKTGTKVLSVISLTDIFQYLHDNIPFDTPQGEVTAEHLARAIKYSQEFGTNEVKEFLG